MEGKSGSAQSSVEVRRRLADASVTLCFKVPFRFRQWFMQQALNRELTMTEFLVLAVESYTKGDPEFPTISSIVGQAAPDGECSGTATGPSPLEHRTMEDWSSQAVAKESPDRSNI
jgi:hypothetical protein